MLVHTEHRVHAADWAQSSMEALPSPGSRTCGSWSLIHRGSVTAGVDSVAASCGFVSNIEPQKHIKRDCIHNIHLLTEQISVFFSNSVLEQINKYGTVQQTASRCFATLRQSLHTDVGLPFPCFCNRP